MRRNLESLYAFEIADNLSKTFGHLGQLRPRKGYAQIFTPTNQVLPKVLKLLKIVAIHRLLLLAWQSKIAIAGPHASAGTRGRAERSACTSSALNAELTRRRIRLVPSTGERFCVHAK
jgi:hypothetical protein